MSGKVWSTVIWYPRWTGHQASPALYQRSGRMKDTPGYIWIHPKGRGWNEMKWNNVTSCFVIMSCRHGWFMVLPPGHAWVVKVAGTFTALMIGLLVGHPSMMKGMPPPLIPFDSCLLAHTHTHTNVLYSFNTAFCFGQWQKIALAGWPRPRWPRSRF